MNRYARITSPLRKPLTQKTETTTNRIKADNNAQSRRKCEEKQYLQRDEKTASMKLEQNIILKTEENKNPLGIKNVVLK